MAAAMTFAVFLVIESGGGDSAAALLLRLRLLLMVVPLPLVLQGACICWTLYAFQLLRWLRYLS